MRSKMNDHRWVLAVSAAVLFPALVLHTTCIAVMGPGTWGSGVEEALPEFKQPDAVVERYRSEFSSAEAAPGGSVEPADVSHDLGLPGRITWIQESGERTIYLTEEASGASMRQRMFVLDGSRTREARIPARTRHRSAEVGRRTDHLRAMAALGCSAHAEAAPLRGKLGRPRSAPRGRAVRIRWRRGRVEVPHARSLPGGSS